MEAAHARHPGGGPELAEYRAEQAHERQPDEAPE
jgi:hypothetical protein